MLIVKKHTMIGRIVNINRIVNPSTANIQVSQEAIKLKTATNPDPTVFIVNKILPVAGTTGS